MSGSKNRITGREYWAKRKGGITDRTKPITARKAYREQHESDFIQACAATRYFKAHGIPKLPSSKTLQAEIERLTGEKNALYNEYREKRERAKELQTIKSNIDQIFRRKPERGKGRGDER